jgi:tripartite-type tricarboxylate transporter receptor subunit TctC
VCEDAAGTDYEAAVDDFPTDEITFIMPLPAGSAPDVTFRRLSELAEEGLGQRIVIVNREGGGGTVGLGELATAEPDGHTIGMGAIAMVAMQPVMQDTTFEGPEDFEPIMNAVGATFVMFSPAGRHLSNTAPRRTICAGVMIAEAPSPLRN